MKFKRTQIYLEPDDHRALLDEARVRRISLAALLREIVSSWTGGGLPPGGGFDSLIGLIDEGDPTDVAARKGDYKREVRERSHIRSTRTRRKR